MQLEPEGLVLDVAPTTRVPICSGCFKRVRAVHNHYEGRRWRHLDVAGMGLWLRYGSAAFAAHAAASPSSWCRGPSRSWFTFDFEQTSPTSPSTRTRRRRRHDAHRVDHRRQHHRARRRRLRPSDALDDLRLIGVDELSYRQHHEYVTIVVDHELAPSSGLPRAKTLTPCAASSKRSGRAVREARSRDARHVGGLHQGGLRGVPQSPDRLRQVPRSAPGPRRARPGPRRGGARPTRDKRALKQSRFALQKNTWNLYHIEHQKLALVQRTNQPLYRAYLLKETLAAILEGGQAKVAGDS